MTVGIGVMGLGRQPTARGLPGGIYVVTGGGAGPGAWRRGFVVTTKL